MLGPKPKHQPNQEKSLASSLLAGTKRKLQEVFGSGTGSNSAPNSPKKRKLATIGSSAMTKAKNALAESTAARQKADQEAADHAAQIASRKDRALRRSTSMTFSSRRSKLLRKATRHSMPALSQTRKTTVNFKRRTPKALSKPGALKPIRKSTGSTSLPKRNAPVLKGKKRGLSASKTPKTPVRSPTPESSDDESPNITPASLRSAAKKNAAKSFTQTKLPFKPLNLGASSSKGSDTFTYPDSDDDLDEFGSTAKRMRKGPKTPNSVRGSVKKTIHRSVRGTKRATAVAKAGAGLGFRGMGGLREGGSRSTVRIITGIDD